MAGLSIEEKCKLAARLIEQSPPGEVNDVINDIRTIIGDDDALMPHVLPALRSYNQTQLHIVEHPAADSVPAHTSLISHASIQPGSEGAEDRYVDAEGKRSFKFDHINLAASEYEPYELPQEEAAFRSELAKSLSAYTKNHFASGTSSVSCSQHPILPPQPEPPVAIPAASAAEGQDAAVTEPVTDIVPEQVGGGEAEPAPTPAVDSVLAKQEDLDEPGGLEKLDEAVEEAKEEEEAVTSGQREVESSGVQQEPVVEESQPEEEPPIAVTAPAPVPAKREQQRVENPIYTLEIVGNRYNPSNFWTGRWRTQWIVDKSAGHISGTINVGVHYYEQGNVQLAAKHTAIFPYPAESGSQSVASQIVTTISKIETDYHLELNDVYGELGDKAFRALRRALPVTRQKMEWEKVSGYSLGSDLTKART